MHCLACNVRLQVGGPNDDSHPIKEITSTHHTLTNGSGSVTSIRLRARAAHLGIHQHLIGLDFVCVDLPDNKALLLAVATPPAASADTPIGVWRSRSDACLVGVVTMSSEVCDAAVPVGSAEVPDKLGHGAEVIGRIVREDQQVLRGGLLHALAEQFECLRCAILNNTVALVLASRPLTISKVVLIVGELVLPTILKLVEVQAHHLQVELRMLTEPTVAGHVESAEIVHITIDLRPYIRLGTAHTGVRMVVVVAVDAVPRHATHLARVYLPPLGIPLWVVLARKPVRVKRVPDIHNKLDIAELVHLEQHLVRNRLLAPGAVEVPVGELIPTPVADRKEGPETVLGRSGRSGLRDVGLGQGPYLPFQGVAHQRQVAVVVG
mmetsp:Transcript_80801/g.261011  ORF Transcript_80801/g.261011 Transcript_80801/m.261011 type:complete len:379 (+) Transcript_80801:101-1237(+)